MRATAAPDASVLRSNCTCTESFTAAFDSALPRIQSRYGRPASARNVISKNCVGVAAAVTTFARPAFGFCSRCPPAAVTSAVGDHPEAVVASAAHNTTSSPELLGGGGGGGGAAALTTTLSKTAVASRVASWLPTKSPTKAEDPR